MYHKYKSMSMHLSSCSNVLVKWKDLNPIQFAQNFSCSLAVLESYWIISWQSAKPHYYYSASDHTWYWLWRQEALLRPFLPFAIEKTMDHKSSKIAHFCSLQIYKTKYYLVVILRLRPSASPILWRKRKVLEHALASYKSFKRPASGQLSPFS